MYEADRVDARGGGGLCTVGDLTWEYMDKDESDFLFHEIFVQNVYMQHGINVMEGDVVFDIGANIGLFSLMCCKVCPGIKVIAVEPIPEIFEVLKRNLSAVNTASVCLVNAALGNPATEKEQCDTFVFFGDAPGESTRRAEERAARLHALAAAVEEQPDGPLKRSLAGSAAHSLTCGVRGESRVCRVLSLHEVIVQSGVACIDLLKVRM